MRLTKSGGALKPPKQETLHLRAVCNEVAAAAVVHFQETTQERTTTKEDVDSKHTKARCVIQVMKHDGNKRNEEQRIKTSIFGLFGHNQEQQ
jgi:hypothetical protein